MIYNELIQRGTYELPMELYQLDTNNPKYEMAHHWHSEFEIIRIISGTLKMSLNRREFSANAGDVIFVNYETVHGAQPQDCVYECIVLSPELLSVDDKVCGDFISDLAEQILVVNDHFKPHDGDIINSCNTLFDVMKRGGCYFEVISALYAVFGTIIKDKLYNTSSNFENSDASKNAKIKKVLSFIRQNYNTPLTLEKIASFAGMSSKYFCYFFKEMTQKSPINYLNDYRIERAARKLLATDLSVTDIAYSCGFNDLSYFIKTFKAAKGITPYKFRKINDSKE